MGLAGWHRRYRRHICGFSFAHWGYARSRLAALTPEQKQKFLPLCPDFVVEIRSPSDRLRTVQAQMQEYLDNGARLGWLFDPPNRVVYVYRPNQPVESLENPATILGDPVLP